MFGGAARPAASRRFLCRASFPATERRVAVVTACAMRCSSTGGSLRQGNTEWHLPSTKAALPSRHSLDTQDAWLQQLLRTPHLQQMVVPRGYPGSVSPGYAGYTGWLAVGLFAHSFTVMVSTNALLSGFFAEMSAASWLMKDLLPPLLAGTLASRIRTLEANPKRWLGAACFANSLLGCVEFLIPHLLPQASWMALAICTNVGKMSGYLIIGASRAVLQKALATGDNLGEVTTKLGTIGMSMHRLGAAHTYMHTCTHTHIGTVGMLMHCFGAASALTLTQYLGFWAQLGAISAGAIVGFYAPMRASQSVVMSSVTTVCLRRIVRRWVSARDTPAWACPSPVQLHEELAARWSFSYSLAARATTWRELLRGDAASGAELRVGGVSLRIAPVLSSPVDVAALAEWRDALYAAQTSPPSTWTLGAPGEGRLLLLYGADARPEDLIEGFAVAWLAALEAAEALCEGREAAAKGLAEASVACLPEWRRESVALRTSMQAAGWQCSSCSIDDVSRRVEWACTR